MAAHGKKYRAAKDKVEDRVYELAEAVEFLKANSAAKFDESVELSFRLGVDTRKSDQGVRGMLSLPHGSGKHVRVLVFAGGDAAEAARTAGADHVGNEDLIEKVKGGWTDFDVAIATPEAMQEVRKLGKVLGPRGLMPNPKSGTVTDDTATAVQESKGGRVEYRMDKHGNVQVPFGRVSFDAGKLCENGNAVVDAVLADRPIAVKGTYVKRCSVSSTMGVSLTINVVDRSED